MNLIFFIRISTSEEIYTTVLFYKECYLGAWAFISPAHFFMIKCGGQDRSGWVREGREKLQKHLEECITFWSEMSSTDLESDF